MTLRSRMAREFEKDGTERELEREPVPPTDDARDRGSQDVIEDTHMVYAGSMGQIIGPKGAKIKEIKEKTSVVSIDTPPKAEDGSRPRARELVPISLKGTRYNIDKAKDLLQAVVDEWVSNLLGSNIMLIISRWMFPVSLVPSLPIRNTRRCMSPNLTAPLRGMGVGITQEMVLSQARNRPRTPEAGVREMELGKYDDDVQVCSFILLHQWHCTQGSR
jgi:hypothetical protein